MVGEIKNITKLETAAYTNCIFFWTSSQSYEIHHSEKGHRQSLSLYQKYITFFSNLYLEWCQLNTSLSNISLEKAVATHSSTLAWKIPWMEKPGRLQSMGSLRVRHNWATSLSPLTFMHWRRKWQSIPVFLPGESRGQGSLMGCRLWGHTELDMTEAT